MADWKDLTKMTNGAPLVVERVKVPSLDLAIEGSFELPALAQLALEDQVFIAQFVRSHGSIKEMERLFDVSYPTIKNRLNKICEKLGGSLAVENDPAPDPHSRSEILNRLDRGEISVKEA